MPEPVLSVPGGQLLTQPPSRRYCAFLHMVQWPYSFGALNAHVWQSERSGSAPKPQKHRLPLGSAWVPTHLPESSQLDSVVGTVGTGGAVVVDVATAVTAEEVVVAADNVDVVVTGKVVAVVVEDVVDPSGPALSQWHCWQKLPGQTHGLSLRGPFNTVPWSQMNGTVQTRPTLLLPTAMSPSGHSLARTQRPS